MDIKRLRYLAGITESMEADMGGEMEADMDMEMSDESSESSGTVCPFCGTKVPHGTLVEHIETEHADVIAYYKETHPSDEEEYDDTTDVEATEFPEDM